MCAKILCNMISSDEFYHVSNCGLQGNKMHQVSVQEFFPSEFSKVDLFLMFCFLFQRAKEVRNRKILLRKGKKNPSQSSTRKKVTLLLLLSLSPRLLYTFLFCSFFFNQILFLATKSYTFPSSLKYYNNYFWMTAKNKVVVFRNI